MASRLRPRAVAQGVCGILRQNSGRFTLIGIVDLDRRLWAAGEILARPEFVTRNTPRLTLQGARLIMAAAARRAKTIRIPMDIAVVDDAGHLLVFNRMDGAKLSSIDIAISKAWTAACTRRGTHEYAEIASPGRPAYGIHVSNQGRFMIVGGGLPIFVGGRIVGGIGCSSGTTQQDRDVATAGIEALSTRTRPARTSGRARRR